MKKFILSFNSQKWFTMVCALMMAVSFASCGGDDDDDDYRPSGGGSSSGGSSSSGYTLSKLAGVWVESEDYDSYNAEIDTYVRQGSMSSSDFVRRGFTVYGIKLNADGTSQDLTFKVSTSRGSGVCLKTIYASDKTVYWTQTSSSSGYRFYINGKKLCATGYNYEMDIVSNSVIGHGSTPYRKVN